MGGDQVAETGDLLLPRVDRGVDGGDVALNDHRDIASAEFFFADDLHIGRFAGGVDRLEHGRETLRFDESECIGSLFGHGGFLIERFVLRQVHDILLNERVEFRWRNQSAARSLGRPIDGIRDRSATHPIGDLEARLERPVDLVNLSGDLDDDSEEVVDLRLNDSHTRLFLHHVQRHHGGRAAGRFQKS